MEKETYPATRKEDMQERTQNDRERDHGNRGASPENEEWKRMQEKAIGDGTPHRASEITTRGSNGGSEQEE